VGSVLVRDLFDLEDATLVGGFESWLDSFKGACEGTEHTVTL
jgi:hypothetical protein